MKQQNHFFAAGMVWLFALIGAIGLLPVTALGQDAGEFFANQTHLSQAQHTATPFTALAAQWEQNTEEGVTVEVWVRFLRNGVWGAWNEMHGDMDGFTEHDENSPVAYIATNATSTYQYKVVVTTPASKETQSSVQVTSLPKVGLKFTPIHAQEKVSAGGPVAKFTKNPENSFLVAAIGAVGVQAMKAEMVAAAQVKVISRAQWGADETLRVYKEDSPEAVLVPVEESFYEQYADELKLSKKITKNEKGEDLTWPQDYAAKVSKIIVHHTATESNLDNPKQAIRDIYHYHAITRGWGDIGYNYIIDQSGNIYEGRAGGDGVVGAHSGTANVGSIGIAVLGNYQNNDVPSAVLKALASLMQVKAAKYRIDLAGTSSFRGQIRPNVMGHRDVMKTSCPGEKLYNLLPALVGMSGDAIFSQLVDRRRDKSAGQAYDYEIVESWPQFEMDAASAEEIDVSIKNTGKQNWDASTMMVAMSTTTTGFFENPANMKSKAAGKIVKPGETVTFVIPLKSLYKGGFTNLELFPLIGGKTAIQKYVVIPVQVNAAHYDFELTSVNFSQKYPRKGETFTATVKLMNTGNITWEGKGKNAVSLGTENPRDKVSRLMEVPGTRLARLNEQKIEPGQEGTFTVKLKAPMIEGYHREYFTPVVEGVAWMPSHGDVIEFYVGGETYSAAYQGTGNMGTFAPGQQKEAWLEFENTGRVNWKKTGTVTFKGEVTPDSGVTVTNVELDKDIVMPGETARLRMNIKVPQKEGTYRVRVMPKYGSRSLLARPVMLIIVVDDKAVDTGLVTTSPATSPSGVPAASAAATSEGPHIRIGLGFKGNPVISGTGSFRLLDGAKDLSTFKSNEKVNVTYSGGKYKVKTENVSFSLSNPPKFVPSGSTVLRIDNYENRPAWKPELNDNQFRGTLEVHWYNSELKVVNELALEPYLRGLAEISATDPYEKIKAVIILARSYAYYYATGSEIKFPGAPYHLQDDPQTSQKYLGYSFEIRNQTGVKAVNDTAATVVYYNKKVIKTPYFSTSNGTTKSAQEVWGWTNAPYLISVDDPGCKGMTQNGHGVGLSGCGAKYWAEKGKKTNEIIQYYFQGVDIKKAY